MRKRSLKTISIALALVMLCGSLVFAAIPEDVADSEHKGAITALIEAGVITGDIDGLFHPFDNLTRAQACIIIVRAINPPDAEIIGTPTQSVPASGFPDMRGYGWAEGYVSYAVRYNIVTGFPDGTFRPGDNVTSNEMLTMALRAIGFTNEEIGPNWPADFVAKANQEGITAGLSDPLPNLATKEVAARMAYNKLEELRATGAARHGEDSGESGTDNGNNQNIPWDVENLTFATGRFNDNMTTFAGVPINPNVVVYTYGLRAGFNRTMELPASLTEYRRDTVHKFKLANTPAFYARTGNEITLMILPMDAGFSGRIYGVINSVSNTTDGRGEQVQNIHTLVAGRQVSWLTDARNNSLPTVLPPADHLNGQIFELTSQNGMIRRIATAQTPLPDRHPEFEELTDGWTAANGWAKVKDISRGTVIVELGSNEYQFAIADNAVVYILNSDGQSYRVGSQWDIREGSEIRAFMIDDEQGETASHITVNRR